MRSRTLESSTFSFREHPSRIASNHLLREPQRDACAAIEDHFRQSSSPAIVQIPVGCGKTGLISILPFLLAHRRVLIVAPNLTIREALFKAVDSGARECFWRNMRVAKARPSGPFAAHLDGPDATLSDCLQSQFVVTNVQQISNAKSKWLKALPADFFDLILFDEGHHNAAKSWQRIIDHFASARIISLTATPFRSDGQELTGDVVYQYPFLRAMARGYIKTLESVQVRPRELAFTLDGESQEVSLNDVLSLREEVWFSKGVALADECNRHIVNESIEQWQRLRREGETKHQIIASACSVAHAVRIAELYRDAGVRAQEIHSGQSKSRQEYVLRQLRTGSLDAIVQVQMLGEGFDHPSLSVAAIFRPFRTLSPYIQFVGRIMRVTRQHATGSLDNRGVVVSHVGLNTEQHWEQFRELDSCDQSLWSGLANGISRPDESEAANTSAKPEDISFEAEGEKRRFAPQMLVEWELTGELDASAYCETACHDFADECHDPALDRTTNIRIVGPQKRRREARSKLKQRVDKAIREVLYQTNLSPVGSQVSRRIPQLRRMNNWNGIRFWIYCELNRLLHRKPGKSREWTLEEIESAVDMVPQLIHRLTESLSDQQTGNRTRSRGAYAGWRTASNW